MANLLLNRWFQLGAAIAITAVAGVVIGVVIAESETVTSVKDVAGTVATGELSDGTEVFGKVTLRTGGGIQSRAESVRVIGEPPLGQDFATGLPMTAAEAVAAGWKDPILCRVGRGRYFQKGNVDEDEQLFLMYNSKDRLIGIYHFSEDEMRAPSKVPAV